MLAAVYQARLMPILVEGRWPSPVCLPVRMLSSTRACGRWRAFRNWAVLPGVLVAMSW